MQIERADGGTRPASSTPSGGSQALGPVGPTVEVLVDLNADGEGSTSEFTSVPRPPTARAANALALASLEEVAQRVSAEHLDDDDAAHLNLGGHPICLARSGDVVYAILGKRSHGHVPLLLGRGRGRSPRGLAARLPLRPHHLHDCVSYGDASSSGLSSSHHCRRPRRCAPAIHIDLISGRPANGGGTDARAPRSFRLVVTVSEQTTQNHRR